MSDYNFQQFTRDMAQAAQLSAANEAAKNSARLLEAQKQQAAIEQQKLQLDQIRLQEERARHEAAQNKLERHKAIRNAMAEIERVIRSFNRDLAAGRLNQTISGVLLISFIGALTKRQLQMVVACKDELEDLSDIRFMVSLQESFEDLAAVQPEALAGPMLENAINKLKDLAGWSGAAGDQYKTLETEVVELSQSFRSSREKQNSLSKIHSNLEIAEANLQKINGIEALAERLWPEAQESIHALESFGISSEEVEQLIGLRPFFTLQKFKEHCVRLRGEIENTNKILTESKAAWHSDKKLFDECMNEISQENWSKVRSIRHGVKRSDWADFEFDKIEIALKEEEVRIEEIAAKKASRHDSFLLLFAIIIFSLAIILVIKM